MAADVVGEPADQPGELAAVGRRPVGEERGEPLVAGKEELAEHPVPLGG